MSLVSAVIDEANKTSTENFRQAREDLLPRIVDLTERLNVFSWGLQNFYTDVYLTSDSSRSLELMNYKNRKYRAVTDLDDLQKEIEIFRKNFGENSEEINNASKKLDAVVDFFNKSCTLVDGTYVVRDASLDLKSLKYVDSVTKLKYLHKELDKMHFEGDLATALRNFRAISETQLAVSQAQLSIDWSKLFKWNSSRDTGTLLLSLSVQQNDPILLHRVLRALYVADQLMIELHEFSEFFIADVLPNVINHNCEISIEDQLGALVFTIKINSGEGSCPTIPNIFNNLMAIFEFLQSSMGSKLEPDKKFIECFGDCNREQFFKKIIRDCIKKNLPSCNTSYQFYKEIVSELETFNKFLVDMKYVTEGESPIKKYVENTDFLLYDTKCTKMVAEIRELMKNSLTQQVLTVGSNDKEGNDYILDLKKKKIPYKLKAPLFFPKCVISVNVRKISVIITQYLEESAHLPAVYGEQLVAYIKDVAVMYECAASERNRSKLERSPLEIAIFFNNCNYLAHTLVGPPWKNILPKTLANNLNTTLISHIYDLRVAGIEKLSSYLKENRNMIASIIRGQLFQLSLEWNEAAFERFNLDVNHCLCYLKEMRSTWSEVLPSRVYEQAMCSLAGAVCDSMTKYALRRAETGTPVAESVALLLASRFQFAMEQIKTVFIEDLLYESKIKSWARFVFIPKLFRAHLLEIAHMWNEGNELNCHFTCEEIRNIIKIRFPSSNYRLKVIKEVE